MTILKIVVGLLSTVLFLYLAARGVEIEQLSESLLKTDYALFSFAMLLTLTTMWVRSWRWGLILQPVKKVQGHSLFAITMIGFMANNVLPLRAGEVAKAFLLRGKENVGLSSGFATITLERIFDGIAVSLISLVLFFMPTIPMWVRQVTLGLAAVFAFALVGFWALAIYKQRVLTWVALEPRFRGTLSKKLDGLLVGFTQGLTILQDKSSVIKISLLSCVVWLGHIAIFHCILLSLQIALPFTATLAVLIFTFIAVILPSAPGYVGTFQYFAVLALAAFVVPKDLALAYAVVLHASMWIPVTLVGLGYAWALGLSLSGLRTESTDLSGLPA